MKGGKKRNQDRTCTPGRELGKWKDPLPGNPFTGGEISWERKGVSEAWRTVQQLHCGRHNRRTERNLTDGPGHPPALPSPRHTSPGAGGNRVLKLKLQRTDLGRGQGLAVQRHPEEAGVWSKLQLELGV